MALAMSVLGAAAAASAEPPASGAADGSAGAPAIVVGSGFRDGRLKVLDSTGRPVALGAEPGRVVGGSICPGGRFMLETVVVDTGNWGPGPSSLEVRDLATMQIVRTVAPPDAGSGGYGQIRCLSEDASEIAWANSSEIGVLGSQNVTVATGSWWSEVLGAEYAFVVPGNPADESGKGGPAEVHSISLQGGTDTLLYRLPPFPDAIWDIHSIETNPAGDRVAVVDWVTAPAHVHTLRVFDPATGEPISSHAFPGHEGVTRAWWLDDRTIVVTFLGEDNQHAPWGTVLTIDAASGETIDEAHGLGIWPSLVTDGVFLGAPLSGQPETRLAAAAIGADPQAVIASFDTVELQGVDSRYRAGITIIGTLPAFDGGALLASIADRSIDAPLGDVTLLGGGVIAIVLVVGAALLVVWRRGRGATAAAGVSRS